MVVASRAAGSRGARVAARAERAAERQKAERRAKASCHRAAVNGERGGGRGPPASRSRRKETGYSAFETSSGSFDFNPRDDETSRDLYLFRERFRVVERLYIALQRRRFVPRRM